MKTLSTSIVGLWGLLTGISPAFASEPLPVLTQSPLAALRALPAQRSAEVEAGLSWSFVGSIANHSTVQGSDSGSLFLDGQSDVLSLAFRYGFLEDWDVELTVPWRHHSGGFTDKLITDWHKLFGLPNADRDLYPVDDLRYRLSLPGHQRELDESASGIGDVHISINRSLLVIDGGQLSVGAGAKMSTGKAADWLGSGATDYYALMRFTGQQLNRRPVYWHGQLGTTFAGRSELLGETQKRSLWFAGLAVFSTTHTVRYCRPI